MNKHTLGQIFKLGLLKNSKGEPYKHRATISSIASKLGTEDTKTQWGMAKTLTEDQIMRYNKETIIKD